jgi:glyoxylase-like metal-dependent hydrolase (beta-lactamase superfamily II)/ferredoxin
MALLERRLAENVAGDFFVDNTCIDCDLCRQIAPRTFESIGDQSAVFHQPETPEEELAALKALITCPTASIGTTNQHSAKLAVASYPDPIDDNVFFCGFASESSFGASSYLIVRSQGNVLIDSPRFAKPLVNRIEKLGGLSTIFLTHRDDVADHQKWSDYFRADRIMHRDDLTASTRGIERVIEGQNAVALDEDLIAVPTPGHTRGHCVLLYRNLSLFAGDHLWWSDERGALAASRSVCWYSWPDQIRSMEKLLNYEFEWVLPGHGRRINLERTAMHAELKRCIARMKGHSHQLAS